MGQHDLHHTTRHVPSSIRSRSLYIILTKAGIKNAYVTGSVALGCAKQESDLDIVVPISCRDLIATVLKQHIYSIEESIYNSGFKFSSDGFGRPINIIPLHPLDWHAWLWATRTLAEKDLTHYDRNYRHRLFEFAVLAYKTLLAQPRNYGVESLDFGLLDYDNVIVTED